MQINVFTSVDCDVAGTIEQIQAGELSRRWRYGMDRGLYIAATGMTTAMVRQDVIAANLANVATVGYKTDRVVNETFAENLSYSMQGGSRHSLGSLNYGTRVAGTITDFSQGDFRASEHPFDVALAGDGFFSVRKQDGTVAYTRDGQFMRSGDGFLMTQQGEYVLGPDRLPVFAGTDGEPVITADGQVKASDGTNLGQIAVVTLDIPSAVKVGGNEWLGEETGGMPGTTQLKQKFVEASTVKSVQEMVEMISTVRSYESSQRVIQAIDGTLDKAVNSVGALG